MAPFFMEDSMTDIKEMTEDEIRERKKLLAYQAFFIEIENAVLTLKNRLEANGTDKTQE